MNLEEVHDDGVKAKDDWTVIVFVKRRVVKLVAEIFESKKLSVMS